MAKICDVCGNYSGFYPLCIKCFRLKEENKIKKCDTCGKWHLIEKPCNCKNINESKKENVNATAINEKEKEIKKDYKAKQYTKQAIIKKIEDNNSTDIRKKWETNHQCDDGHYVRSYSEVLIDNWFYNNRIVHAYEKSVFMPNNPDEMVLSDFYLPDGDVYIEFWGLKNNDYYENRKEYKINLYKNNNLNLINLEENDIKRLNDILPRLLHEFMKK